MQRDISQISQGSVLGSLALLFEVSLCMAAMQKIHEYYVHGSFFRHPSLCQHSRNKCW